MSPVDALAGASLCRSNWPSGGSIDEIRVRLAGDVPKIGGIHTLDSHMAAWQVLPARPSTSHRARNLSRGSGNYRSRSSA